jgi:hypothetical protein
MGLIISFFDFVTPAPPCLRIFGNDGLARAMIPMSVSNGLFSATRRSGWCLRQLLIAVWQTYRAISGRLILGDSGN